MNSIMKAATLGPAYVKNLPKASYQWDTIFNQLAPFDRNGTDFFLVPSSSWWKVVRQFFNELASYCVHASGMEEGSTKIQTVNLHCLRSKKRTLELFAGNQGTKVEDDEQSLRKKLAAKVNDEYGPIKHLPPPPKPVAQTAPTKKSIQPPKESQKEEVAVTGTHKFPPRAGKIYQRRVHFYKVLHLQKKMRSPLNQIWKLGNTKISFKLCL